MRFLVRSVITYCYSFVFISECVCVSLVTIKLIFAVVEEEKEMKKHFSGLGSQQKQNNNAIENVSDFGFRKNHGENDD